MTSKFPSIAVLKTTPQYLVVNKPLGITCDGYRNHGCLMPQLTKLYPGCHISLKVVNRLDKYVSGGIVVGRDEAFVRMANTSHREENKLIVKRYVGVIGVSGMQGNNIEQWVRSLEGVDFQLDGQFRGSITSDLSILNRDYSKRRTESKKRFLKTVSATTKIALLPQLLRRAPPPLLNQYNELFGGKVLLPMILETTTGRKNQLRDHVLQTFGVSLLNDDNFAQFKMHSANKESAEINSLGAKDERLALINSTIFKSNQIGLHAGYLKVGRSKGLEVPLTEGDQDLWRPFLGKDGAFVAEISDALRRPIQYSGKGTTV